MVFASRKGMNLRSGRKGKWRAAALLASATLMAAPLHAEDAKDPAVAVLEKETALVKAQGDLIAAQNAKIAAQAAPIAGLAGEGKFELGADAGVMEAWLLTADVMGQAAENISKNIGSGPIVVVAGDERLDFLLMISARKEAESIEAQMSSALRTTSCPGQNKMMSTGVESISAVVGALGSIFKSDVSVTGLKLDPSDRMFATAVARKLTDAYIPSALVLPDTSKSSLSDRLEKLFRKSESVEERLKCLSTPEASKEAKEGIASLEEAKERHDLFMDSLTSSDKDGVSRLARVLALEALEAKATNVLRVHVERSGGSVLKTKNVLTSLGFPAVGVTGGFIASFEVTESKTGKVLHAGIVVCRTRKASLGSIQSKSGKAPDNSCSVLPA